MLPKLVVLADVDVLDYEMVSTQLLRVSYQEYQEQFELCIDLSNPPLAAMLKQYVEEEGVSLMTSVSSLDVALYSADCVLIFTTPLRKSILTRCDQENERRKVGLTKDPLKLYVVAQ